MNIACEFFKCNRKKLVNNLSVTLLWKLLIFTENNIPLCLEQKYVVLQFIMGSYDVFFVRDCYTGKHFK